MPSQNKPYLDIKLALRRSELPYLAGKSETEKDPVQQRALPIAIIAAIMKTAILNLSS